MSIIDIGTNTKGTKTRGTSTTETSVATNKVILSNLTSFSEITNLIQVNSKAVSIVLTKYEQHLKLYLSQFLQPVFEKYTPQR